MNHNEVRELEDACVAARQKTLSAAYAATPERFVQREPRPLRLPDAVWINPPAAPAKSPENPLPALHQIPKVSVSKSLTRSDGEFWCETKRPSSTFICSPNPPHIITK
jgi:hypothetical protein